MSSYLEILELNQQTIATLCQAYDGYGDITARWAENRPDESSRPEKGAYIGGAYVTAGIYCSLYDQKRAAGYFRKAIPFYKNSHQPFWKLLSICGLEQIDYDYLETEIKSQLSIQAYFYDWMLTSFYRTETRKAFNNWYEGRAYLLKQWMAHPMGRLGIPILNYIDLTSENKATAIASMNTILQRSGEHIRYLQSDRYHWQRMVGAVPYEPEVLAASIVFLVAQQRYEKRINAIVEEFENNDPINSLPVLIAREMIENLSPGIINRRPD